uniref:Adipokinetic hormone receptor n=1 Tax=Nilaparvata lugens TaxID=108931 RepID=W6EAI5_NILLU|nr:G protein-coupled receptor [Nilaparvata lugens]AZP54622.1 adipokinetic hormone receptor [Nilaparvata lugens]
MNVSAGGDELQGSQNGSLSECGPQQWPHLQLFPHWHQWCVNSTFTFDFPIDMQFNDGHRLSIIAYSTLMLLSAIGNFTVLSILIRRRRNNINNMLIHLAIADLLVTFLLMPLEIAWSATVMWWAGDAWCRVTAFFRTFGLFQSSFVLVCISIDRYFAVLKPMNHLSDVDRRGKIMLSCAWIGSVLCSLPQMLVFRVQAHPYVPWFEQCITIWFAQDAKNPSVQEFVYFVFGMLMMYCIPFLVILFCYASILGEIYRHLREDKSDRFRRSSLGFLGKAKGRTLKTTVIIVVVFLICWTPYYFMSLWHFFDHKGSQKVDQKLQKGLYIFACTNSCMNPIVYGAFNIRPRRTDRRGGAAGGVGGQRRRPIHQLSDDSIQISRLSSTVSNGSQTQRNDTKQSVVFSL